MWLRTCCPIKQNETYILSWWSWNRFPWQPSQKILKMAALVWGCAHYPYMGSREILIQNPRGKFSETKLSSWLFSFVLSERSIKNRSFYMVIHHSYQLILVANGNMPSWEYLKRKESWNPAPKWNGKTPWVITMRKLVARLPGYRQTRCCNGVNLWKQLPKSLATTYYYITIT